MNYQKIYNDLITGRQRKILTEGYTERHHIIPRCSDGILTIVKMHRNKLKLLILFIKKPALGGF